MQPHITMLPYKESQCNIDSDFCSFTCLAFPREIPNALFCYGYEKYRTYILDSVLFLTFGWCV